MSLKRHDLNVWWRSCCLNRKPCTASEELGYHRGLEGIMYAQPQYTSENIHMLIFVLIIFSHKITPVPTRKSSWWKKSHVCVCVCAMLLLQEFMQKERLAETKVTHTHQLKRCTRRNAMPQFPSPAEHNTTRGAARGPRTLRPLKHIHQPFLKRSRTF